MTITYGTPQGWEEDISTTEVTRSFTCAGGAAKALLVIVASNSSDIPAHVTAAKYNGVNMAVGPVRYRASSTGNYHIDIESFWLSDPAAGAHNIGITWSANSIRKAGLLAVEVSGANVVSFVGTSGGMDATNDSTPSFNLTTGTDNSDAFIAFSSTEAQSGSLDSPAVELLQLDLPNGAGTGTQAVLIGYRTTTTAGLYTLGAAHPAGTNWPTLLGFEIKPALTGITITSATSTASSPGATKTTTVPMAITTNVEATHHQYLIVSRGDSAPSAPAHDGGGWVSGEAGDATAPDGHARLDFYIAVKDVSNNVAMEGPIEVNVLAPSGIQKYQIEYNDASNTVRDITLSGSGTLTGTDAIVANATACRIRVLDNANNLAWSEWFTIESTGTDALCEAIGEASGGALTQSIVLASGLCEAIGEGTSTGILTVVLTNGLAEAIGEASGTAWTSYHPLGTGIANAIGAASGTNLVQTIYLDSGNGAGIGEAFGTGVLQTITLGAGTCTGIATVFGTKHGSRWVPGAPVSGTWTPQSGVT